MSSCTDPALGLSESEVAARLERHGPNQISEAGSHSKLRMLLAQFTDFMILLLVAAAIVSGFIGKVAAGGSPVRAWPCQGVAGRR